MESIKNDMKDGKPRWDLLPLLLVEKIVEVFSFGAKKYAPNTWQKLPDGYTVIRPQCSVTLQLTKKASYTTRKADCFTLPIAPGTH